MSDPWFVQPPVQKGRGSVSRRLFTMLLLVGTASAIYHVDPVGRVAYAVTRGKLKAEREYLTTVSPEHVASLDQISKAFHLVAEVVKPSVVSIRSLKRADDDMGGLRNFFGRSPGMSANVGAGVVFDKDGYIVTSNHVIAEADKVQVEMEDGRSFNADVVQTDRATDLAVLKIEATGLHPATFGDSDATEVGHVVLAVGSPFRLSQTVSHGIISAKGRRDVGLNIDYQDFIQSDCPINPGNSGGPLVNTRGQVIGINTAIATDSGSFSGIGFATPSNKVVAIANELKSGKRVTRGYLGVAIGPLTAEIARQAGLDEDSEGVVIGEIASDGPAEKAGLLADDIVLSINGKTIKDVNALQEAVAATKPNGKLSFQIWRDGKTKDLKVAVGEQPRDFSPRGGLPRIRREPDESDIARNRPRGGSVDSLGIEVKPVTPELLAEHDLEDADIRGGVMVVRVDPKGLAHTLEIKPGTVITSIGRQRVRGLDDLNRILTAEALAEGVRMRTVDAEGSHSIFVQSK